MRRRVVVVFSFVLFPGLFGDGAREGGRLVLRDWIWWPIRGCGVRGVEVIGAGVGADDRGGWWPAVRIARCTRFW